tara:strand:+ start:539 stop:1228 length:690 start_codon:yes stop_codon:yes gene_type:complete
MIKNSSNKKKKLINIIKLPLIFLALMWAVKLSEIIWSISFVEYGVLPREASGIQGILFSPFIHKDIKHLLNNSIPILILGSSLCYFFKKNFKKVFPLLFVFSGVLLWCLGRTNLHIGASGIIYSLASFIFFSGLISNNKNLSALSLIVIFIYGSLFWGLFPTQQEISWEGHLSGFIAGMIFAWFFREDLPKRKKYQWEIDEEIEKLELKNEKTKSSSVIINYDYKEKKD